MSLNGAPVNVPVPVPVPVPGPGKSATCRALAPKPDKRRYYLTARGSATESAALLDVCLRLGLMDAADHKKGKDMIVRIVSMLIKQLGSTFANRGIALRLSCCWPAVTSKATGSPSASTTRWTLVVRPPREQPIAFASAPLGRRRRAGALDGSCCRDCALHANHRGPVIEHTRSAVDKFPGLLRQICGCNFSPPLLETPA